MTKHSKLLSLAACIGTLFAVAPASALVTIDLPRTLDGYVEQDKAFWDYLKANHPYFKSYLKEGRWPEAFLYGLDGLYEAQGNVKSLKWH